MVTRHSQSKTFRWACSGPRKALRAAAWRSGDRIFDIASALEADLFTGAARDAAEAASGRSLNPLLEAGHAARQALRRRVGEILDAKGADAAKIQTIANRLVHDSARCTLHLPARVGDFTDFFAGIHHAYTAGTISRPENR